jgi:hypothetical protein
MKDRTVQMTARVPESTRLLLRYISANRGDETITETLMAIIRETAAKECPDALRKFAPTA